jgi:hypothetical protein
LERRSGDFETESDEDERETKEDGGMVRDGDEWQDLTDGDEVRLASGSKKPGDSVNQEAGRERAEDEVFRACLKAGHAPAEVGDLDVERDRDELKRTENHDEVGGRNHPHEPRAGENGQDKKLAGAGTGAFGGNQALNDRQVVHRHHQHQNRGDEDEAFEEQRKAIHHIESRHLKAVGVWADEKCADENCGEAADGPPGEGGFFLRETECLGHEQKNSQDDDADFQKNGIDHG